MLHCAKSRGVRHVSVITKHVHGQRARRYITVAVDLGRPACRNGGSAVTWAHVQRCGRGRTGGCRCPGGSISAHAGAWVTVPCQPSAFHVGPRKPSEKSRRGSKSSHARRHLCKPSFVERMQCVSALIWCLTSPLILASELHARRRRACHVSSIQVRVPTVSAGCVLLRVLVFVIVNAFLLSSGGSGVLVCYQALLLLVRAYMCVLLFMAV